MNIQEYRQSSQNKIGTKKKVVKEYTGEQKKKVVQIKGINGVPKWKKKTNDDQLFGSFFSSYFHSCGIDCGPTKIVFIWDYFFFFSSKDKKDNTHKRDTKIRGAKNYEQPVEKIDKSNVYVQLIGCL